MPSAGNQYPLMKIYTRLKKRIGSLNYARPDPSTMEGNCKGSADCDWFRVIVLWYMAHVLRRIPLSMLIILDAFSPFSILWVYRPDRPRGSFRAEPRQTLGLVRIVTMRFSVYIIREIGDIEIDPPGPWAATPNKSTIFLFSWEFPWYDLGGVVLTIRCGLLFAWNENARKFRER